MRVGPTFWRRRRTDSELEQEHEDERKRSEGLDFCSFPLVDRTSPPQGQENLPDESTKENEEDENETPDNVKGDDAGEFDTVDTNNNDAQGLTPPAAFEPAFGGGFGRGHFPGCGNDFGLGRGGMQGRGRGLGRGRGGGEWVWHSDPTPGGRGRGPGRGDPPPGW